MSKLVVKPDTDQPFMSRFKINPKELPLGNASQKRLNLDSKWKMEKQLLDNIISPTNKGQTPLSELRHILHRIVGQITSSEFTGKPDTVNMLMGVLVDRVSASLSQAHIKQQLTKNNVLERGTFVHMDEFSCQRCCELLYNPMTLPCGHSFCRSCLSQGLMKLCIICNKKILQDELPLYKTNVVMTKVLQSWHSIEWFARSLIIDGLQLFDKAQYRESVKAFTQALDIVPHSHIATLHRAKAYYLQNMLNEALADAVRASILAHRWPEAYYIKGKVLYKLHCLEESLLSLLICFVLDPNKESAKDIICKIVSKLVDSVVSDLKKPIASEQPSSSCSSPKKRPYSPGVCQKRKADCFEADIPSINDFGAIDSDARSALTLDDLSNESYSDLLSSTTHVQVSFEHSSDKSRESLPFTDEQSSSGTFPSVASELEKALDVALLKIDSAVSKDMNMLLTSAFDKELLEALNLKPPTERRKIKDDAVDATDLECILCMRMYYEPVCTPCGHTFCQLCIQRCLDHNAQCPLCKQSMQHFLAESLEKLHPTCDYVTKTIIEQHLPEYLQERVTQHQEEMMGLMENQPIFVCTIAFPSVPCPLHIFEPRYRLMLRRCLDFNEREFGMCLPDKDKSHQEVGTMLKVRDVSFFSDGRSVVDSIGCRRFRTSQQKIQDGYHVAKIDFIVDKKPTDPIAVDNLSAKVYGDSRIWFQGLPPEVKTRITQHFGVLPERDEGQNGDNGPDWVWWMLAVLPVENRVKAKVLGKDVLQERLLIIHKIMTCLRKRRK